MGIYWYLWVYIGIYMGKSRNTLKYPNKIPENTRLYISWAKPTLLLGILSNTRPDIKKSFPLGTDDRQAYLLALWSNLDWWNLMYFFEFNIYYKSSAALYELFIHWSINIKILAMPIGYLTWLPNLTSVSNFMHRVFF